MHSLGDIVNDKPSETAENGLLLERDYFLKHVILLETRLAKNIPNYDYSKMKNDEWILSYEKAVEKKLN